MVVCGKDGVDMGCNYNLDEDASYYAEIEKQILELMTDDDKDDIVHFRGKASGYGVNDSARVNRRSDVVGSYSLPPRHLFNMSVNGGTGVFIPQIVNPSPASGLPSESVMKKGNGRRWRCRQKGKRHQLQVPRRTDQNLQLIALHDQ